MCGTSRLIYFRIPCDKEQMRPIVPQKWAHFPATVLLALLAAAPASAHPHVWVTVRSELDFAPDGKIIGLVQDWKFDEMYSSFAVQGLAKDGGLAKREDFVPMATENTASLAEAGFYTILKIGGKQADFGNVTEFWMEEGRDKLVNYHVVLPLRAPTAPGRLLTLQVADPEFFIDFEFDDRDGLKLVNAPSGCSNSLAKPKPLEAADKTKLTESFFSGLAIGSNFGFKMATHAIIACP